MFSYSCVIAMLVLRFDFDFRQIETRKTTLVQTVYLRRQIGSNKRLINLSTYRICHTISSTNFSARDEINKWKCSFIFMTETSSLSFLFCFGFNLVSPISVKLYHRFQFLLIKYECDRVNVLLFKKKKKNESSGSVNSCLSIRNHTAFWKKKPTAITLKYFHSKSRKPSDLFFSLFFCVQLKLHQCSL